MSVNPDMKPPNQTQTGLTQIDFADVETFFELYKRAWQERDVDLAESLFTQDVDYRERRFGQNLEGHGSLRCYWQHRVFEHQRDIRYSYSVWGVRGREAMVCWQASYLWLPINSVLELDGVLRVGFSHLHEGHLVANRFLEWFDSKEVGQGP